ncbi:MAG TPA: hypothetical protein VGF67_27260 [Ktedonobacteraceae bacterium]|jgi:hypothetical protein
MIDDRQTFEQKIQQLWYTVATIGIERQAYSGFRIRAASRGISNDPEYVNFLEGYVRYDLPRGTELMVVQPEEAPVGLSLIRPEDSEHAESILVHKVYVRQEGGDRGGVFFTHLLSKLPRDLSAADALALWENRSVWHTSDKSLDPMRTELAEVARETLWSQRPAFTWQSKGERELVKAYLPFLLQAFLEKYAPPQPPEQRQPGRSRRFRRSGAARQKQGSQATRREKIYIAAADRDVALLIHALILCLPEQFRKTLTFSTYEYNPASARVEIVGICWLDHRTAHNDSRIPDLLAGIDPHEQLVLNCYHPEQSSALDRHPALLPRPLARDYADVATEYFLLSHDSQKAGRARSPEEEQLLNNFGYLFMDAQFEQELDVDRLLALYDENVRNPVEVTDEALRTLLESLHARKIALKLSRVFFQRALLQRALHSAAWLTRAGKAIQRWHAWHDLEVEQALEQTAHLCQRHLSSIIHNGPSGAAELLAGQADLDTQFEHGICLLYWLTNLEQIYRGRQSRRADLQGQGPAARIYLDLLESLRKSTGSSAFFERHLKTYGSLVNLWSDLLLAQEQVRGNIDSRTVERLIFILPSPLEHFDTFTGLYLDPLWQGMIMRTWLEREPGRERFMVLLFQHYPWYLQELFTRLLKRDQTTQLPVYEQGWSIAEGIFQALPRQFYPQKWPLLSSLLAEMPPQAARTLVKPEEFSSGERAAFLRQFGPRYLPDSRLAPAIFQILSDLSADQGEGSARMEVLFTLLESREPDAWLKKPGPQELTSLLSAARLTPQESGTFLRSYGSLYYHKAPGIPVLGTLLSQYLALYQEQCWRWELASWVPQYGERELSFFKFLLTQTRQPLPADLSQLFTCWYRLIPVLINPGYVQSVASDTTAASSMILNDQRLQAANRDYIIERLAIGCLMSQSALPDIASVLSSRLSPEHFLRLLYTIADQAGMRSRANEDLALFEICIFYASAAKRRFNDEERARTFLRLFLEALLHHTSPALQDQLQQRAQTWDAAILTDWQMYQRTHPLVAVSQLADPGKERRLKREYRRALRSLRSALKKQDDESIFQAHMEHLVTIQLRSGELAVSLGQSRWEEIADHLKQFAAYAQAERYSQFDQTTHILKKPRFWMRPVFWWRRLRTLSPLARALRSRRMGKIVHCLKKRGSQLDPYRSLFAQEWQALIDPALAFFEACLQEDTQSNEQLKAREQAIIQAYQNIVALNKNLERPLLLSEHERRRVVFAEQTCAEILRQQRRSMRLREFLALGPALLPR